MSFKIEKIEIRNIGEKMLMDRNRELEHFLRNPEFFYSLQYPTISIRGYLYVKVEKYLYNIGVKRFSTEMLIRIRFEMIMIEKENTWIPISIDAIHNPGKKFENEDDVITQNEIDSAIRTHILGEKFEEYTRLLSINCVVDEEFEQAFKKKSKESYEKMIAFNEYQKTYLFDPIMKELNIKETNKVKEELF